MKRTTIKGEEIREMEKGEEKGLKEKAGLLASHSPN